MFGFIIYYIIITNKRVEKYAINTIYELSMILYRKKDVILQAKINV